jgi:hypothetical protein
MSEERDLALIREAYLDWNVHGVNMRFLHPDIEWIDPPQLPGGSTHVGKEAVVAFLREWEGSMGVLNLSFEIEEIIPFDGEYLVISLAQGTGESGVGIPAHNWFHLMKLEDGTIRRARLFLDRAQAFEAAGLSE